MDDKAADEFVHYIASDWQNANLNEVDQALCRFAGKVTLEPAAMSEGDIEVLRELGLSDAFIHDATQIISYFNYINRVADALHVEVEDFIRPWEKAEAIQ